MSLSSTTVRVRPLDELDLTDVARIAERIDGTYDPQLWENRVAYYLRRDPEGALAAEIDGRLAGFMLGEVRSGEFGLTEPTGWVEVLGVDPEHARRSVGRALAESLFEHFRARGARAVRALVDEGMPELVGFFQSLGFETATLRPLVKRL